MPLDLDRVERSLSPPVASLSNPKAQEVFVCALEIGRVVVTSHFSKRCAERGFDVLDAENVIRQGSIIGQPKYDQMHGTWRYEMSWKSGQHFLNLVIALSCNDDYCDSPCITYVTGYYGNKEKAKRRKK